ncbi:Glycosyltransferase involved in cell wall bisynthesis (WcaA) (PDB:5MLZ) [Commensalibacter communis]|uniref:Glycosyltransferase involved in cell wall bisynthesis (WcaA) n=1 Tax=Commensalibacter communis TaxID=2972786 RepID=A0A9W4TMV6_9PROT|nr:glycosyltransferase family 2 protein [Commensalibacter communis]CAI3925005.1 Glycosyltransferase involved in cell wall bisynthesis (WcaA) (PDB:5MLZ) [Commensalibacter communis]CAI3926519.1 Glycosyltransferase involved in cell wall bisynthesis (WcaA) (PDB:5MLZ) [Commensalibacter communis]CAI3935962.1 Glycosyltransferase involved in cell wall bisynthesis (WcaA) (PDB:5MLZ) [Commensalibacter communis]CAI3936473.1 Glycosyltransferase involved in cell wall bisynthesis (WcaA) (PDB:5MLZ) [Commensali
MTIQSRFTGFCQEVRKDIILGWAINASSPQDYVTVSVFIDDQQVAEIKCDQNREDIQKKINFFRNDIGFQFIIPNEFRDGKSHRLSFRFPDNNIISILTKNNPTEGISVYPFQLEEKQSDQVKVLSCMDGWKNGAIHGWVLRQDTSTGKYSGKCQVMVTIDGRHLKTVEANQFRGDVASAVNADARCGFAVVVPRALRKRVRSVFRVYVMPEQIELLGSPYETTLIDDLLEQQLLVLNNQIDFLYKEMTALRTQFKRLVSGSDYVINEYGTWAKKYYFLLPKRLEKLHLELEINDIGYQTPLISIICPVYQPAIKFFKEAVGSVLGQTYQNWELILVDDGGKSSEIKKEIKQLVKQDARIKSVTLKTNKGISEATNAGIKKATGEWIAFFDHDDVLVPQALEMMIGSAQLHQAQMLYSDEDKVDDYGAFVEPHFKPDFNYRYLLGLNYICHFVMVKVGAVKKAGQLHSRYDGAQDHDFLLRLTEVIPHQQIYHVPEVLYHWRKTAGSTAETVDNKEYAIRAGVACVQDHLKRIKKSANVSSIKDFTAYQIEWKKAQSDLVTIVIPFKDQVKTTKECIDRLLEYTNYKNYRIILVDNASREAETLIFLEEYSQYDNIEVLPIHEEFNFSRLNNLATQQFESDFYLFLNNDVFVNDPNWLHILVNEALLSKDVGIVGAKLLYPDGRVQHGGVVVGPEVIGDHMNRGLETEEFGYACRSILSQELTAVTAAMMLIKASVFEELNGFNENHLKIAFNDVDLCLRAREAGYKVVFSADCMAVHHESLSRGTDDCPEHEERFSYEKEYMNNSWGRKAIYTCDPAYSPNFVVRPPLFYELSNPEKTEATEK